MTDEMSDLIKRLNRQAKMYEEIDAGTGYGWEQDAVNIREAIRILKNFEDIWCKLESGVRMRLESPDLYKTVSRMAMILSIQSNILGDMRMLEGELFGRKSNNESGDDP